MMQYSKKSKREKSVASHADVFTRKRSSEQTFLLEPVSTIMFGILVCSITFRLLMGAQPVAQVGDMMDFNRAHLSMTNVNAAVPAHLVKGPFGAPGRACTLEINRMSWPGGVATVNAVRPDGVVMLWSGPATAAGGANCGTNSELLLTNNMYSRLSTLHEEGGLRAVK